jgi:hypothetical protein
MPNPTKFSEAERDAHRLWQQIFPEIDGYDLDHAADVCDEIELIARRVSRQINDKMEEAESERLHAFSQAMHPSLSARERNPSLK